MTPAVRSLILAWQFLTILPLGREKDAPAPRSLANSMTWYPLVGLGIGGALYGVDLLFGQELDRQVLDMLLIGVLVWLTGGLHQDGLADTLDGLGGGRNPADRLAVMRDPRIGAFGATGLMFDIGLRYAGLAAVPDDLRGSVLLCMPVLGRWSMVVGAFGVPYARREGGLARAFLENLSWRVIASATAMALGILIWQFGALRGMAACVAGLMVARGIVRFASRRLGGITGDILGAINEAVEVIWLVITPLLARWL